MAIYRKREASVLKKGEEFTKRVAVFERVTQVGFLDDRVMVASSDPLMGQAASGLQLGDDPLDGAFGDANQIRYLALTDLGIASDRQKHMGVVRQKLPRRRNFHVFTIEKTRRITRTF